jgi:lipopolysaccharide/colanic/teichoic acid biosynthesis glycosyltransferase
MKRTLDLVLVLLAAPLWLPLLAVVALAVWLALGRPLFFRQSRAGLHGRPFTLVKFRTMRLGEGTDAERLSRFGRGLRAASLDELPELWQVIRGKLALVGPRPLPVRYLPRYTPEQARRHEVSPGITGWAQVNGRNALTWEEKFRLDVWYVDHASLWLDLRILVLTVWQVVRGSGVSAAGQATMEEFLGAKSEFRSQN